MTTHSIILSWNIPRREEPGRLQSMWSWRVGHDWASNPQLIWLDVKRWHALCIYCKACKHAGDTQTKAHLLPILTHTHTHSVTHTHTLLFPPSSNPYSPYVGASILELIIGCTYSQVAIYLICIGSFIFPFDGIVVFEIIGKAKEITCAFPLCCFVSLELLLPSVQFSSVQSLSRVWLFVTL